MAPIPDVDEFGTGAGSDVQEIAKLVAENAELTKMRNYLYDTLEGSDDPDVG